MEFTFSLNVYELGIAHCLKESRNVILIKNRETRAPSDIHHITYIEYDKDNIMLLKEEIIASLDRIKYYSDLEDALRIPAGQSVSFHRKRAAASLPIFPPAVPG